MPVLALVALSGCKLLKKKSPDAGIDPSSGSFAAGDFQAANKVDISRFGDERKLFGEVGFVRQLVTVRTAPNEGGTAVGVIDPDKPVTKHAERLNYTLVTFDRPGQLQKWAGWIPNEAFSSIATLPGAAPTATATAAPTATTVATAAPKGTTTASVAGTTTPPETGTCTMTLRTSGFSGSSSSCTFDEKVRAGSPATLTFPCAGGAAKASFLTHTFAGTADKSKVNINRSNVFDFKGCQFRTTQVISGSPPNLSYSYAESIVNPSASACKGMSTCTARATVTAN